MYFSPIDLGTLALSLVAISLPLSAIWASVSLENSTQSKTTKPKPIMMGHSYTVTSEESASGKETMTSFLTGDFFPDQSSQHLEKDPEAYRN
jgi:hypothetical protein